MSGLTEPEIQRLVYDYIGVDEKGYLNGFTYKQHEEFYARFCSLTVDVKAFRQVHGSTRRTFAAILAEASPQDQARIIDGTFAYLPLENFAETDRLKRSTAKAFLATAALRLRGQSVLPEDVSSASQAVDLAIQDADALIRERGNTSGVDRVHTALHGYLKALCTEAGLDVDKSADVGRVFKELRQAHPRLQETGARHEDVSRILHALATIVSSLNPIRNQASLAHPNEELLELPEAALVIDASRSLMNYLSRKLK